MGRCAACVAGMIERGEPCHHKSASANTPEPPSVPNDRLDFTFSEYATLDQQGAADIVKAINSVPRDPSIIERRLTISFERFDERRNLESEREAFDRVVRELVEDRDMFREWANTALESAKTAQADRAEFEREAGTVKLERNRLQAEVVELRDRLDASTPGPQAVDLTLALASGGQVVVRSDGGRYELELRADVDDGVALICAEMTKDEAGIVSELLAGRPVEVHQPHPSFVLKATDPRKN